MTQKWKYLGDGPVDVPALGLTVEPRQTVEVEDPEVSAGLKGQSQWEHIPAKKAAAKKAAPSKPDASNDEKKG